MHRTNPAAMLAFATLATLALFAAPLRAQTDDVDTPVEGAAPTTPTAAPPTTPDITGETPAEPREVLVPAQPEGPRKREKQKLRLGPEVELFFPSASKTRDRYGKSWLGFGAGFGSVRPEGLLGTWSGEIFLIHGEDKGHEAFIVPLGVSYRRALAKSLNSRPYVGASADLVLADFNSPTDQIKWGLRAGGGGSVLAGITFRNVGYVEARYLAVSKMRGIDFSGLNLTGGFRF